MSALTILILALSMSADAFAAALARGAATRPGWRVALRGGAVFGLVETTTPLAGWLLGRLAQELVSQWSHWIAFALLLLVGAHMVRNGLTGEGADEGDTSPPPGGLLLLILTAISTSIDSAAVGIGLAMLDVNILVVAGAIGFSTFICTTIGLHLGARAGHWLGPRAELLAGLALIGLAFVILADAGALIPGRG